MSVCRKHRRQGRSSCSCARTSKVRSDGYGGPDVSSMSAIAFDSLADSAVSGFGSSSYDNSSGSSSSYGGSSYDSGSSSSSSYDSGSSGGGGSD